MEIQREKNQKNLGLNLKEVFSKGSKVIDTYRELKDKVPLSQPTLLPQTSSLLFPDSIRNNQELKNKLTPIYKQLENLKSKNNKVEKPAPVVRREIPKDAFSILANSFTRKYLTLKGPEVHIHLGPEDCKTMIGHFKKDPNSTIVNKSIEEVADTFKKMGLTQGQLDLAAKFSKFETFSEYAKVLINIGVSELYQGTKGKDGSLDIYLPGVYLFTPKKWAKVGTKWFELPQKGQVIKYDV